MGKALDPAAVRGARPLGLLSNVASLSADGRPVLSALQRAGLHISVIFSPEHGYFGLGRAGEAMPDSQFERAAGPPIPIISLHGTVYAPAADQLRPLAAVLVDLQDTGNRWYTYLGTLRHLLHTSAETGTPVIVLDRPNPQGGDVIEGPRAEPAYFSLIAPDTFPARYGLTLGEAARLLNRTIQAPLTVIALDGWRRSMRYADTGLIWASPSPNMPNPEACLLYSATCLIEATNLSEGRGTALPFIQIGAPFISAEMLTDTLNGLALPGVAFSPAWFRPTILKFADQDCQGVRLHVTDPQTVRGFALGVQLLATLRQLYPTALHWITTERQVFWLDRLAATDRLRKALEAGQPPAAICADFAPDVASFRAEAEPLYLYS